MDERMIPSDPLAVLGAHLAAHGLTVELTAKGLVVRNPEAGGYRDQGGRASDTITCRRRPDDGGRRWFYTSRGEPIAEADRIVDARVYVLGLLAQGERP